MGISVTPFDQSRRLLRLDTVLGPDALVAVSLHGEEAMSEGFDYCLDVFSDTVHEIPAEKIVGTAINFALIQEDNSKRYFNGYISEVTAQGRSYGGQRSSYRLSVVPWLWFLGKSTDCRVFQEMTVEDVLKELFAPLGSKARFEFKLTQPHPEHRFLVQYNETSLNFMHRLLRREGIAFYIEHQEDGHVIHFVDEAKSLPELTPATLNLQAGSVGDRLISWEHQNAFATGRFSERSYNYKQADKVQEVETQASASLLKIPGVPDTEQYQYSESYQTTTDGKADVQWRRDQATERHDKIIGTASYRHLAAGRHFKVEQIPTGEWPDHGKEFTLSRLHLAVDNEESLFTASFEAIPKGELAFGKVEQTPLIAGLQTAVVTGPAGEEIHTDELGRIKVQFHWDREGKHDDKTTCWLRVMHSFAGPGFGAHFTPRFGQEVVVAFANGNPDRPFVLGALYHPIHKPPYAGEPTQSGIRTQSTKGGSSDNYNEIRFDDKKGSEHFYVQAEKDLEVYVKNDEKRKVDNDQEIGVKNNAEIKVGNKLKIHAGSEIEIVVGGSSIKLTGNKLQIGSAVVDIDGGTIQLN